MVVPAWRKQKSWDVSRIDNIDLINIRKQLKTLSSMLKTKKSND